LVRGTRIDLSLKEDMSEFLEEKKLKELKELIKRHSEFIGYSITLHVEKSEEKEFSDNEDADKKKIEDNSEDKIDEVNDNAEKKKKNKKKV
jgi:molecular chaperone HtpG